MTLGLIFENTVTYTVEPVHNDPKLSNHNRQAAALNK